MLLLLVHGSQMRDLAVVILAGGEGRRIGGGKPERFLWGRRLIDLAAEKAARWSNTMFVGVRIAGQVRMDAAVEVIDLPHIEGPLSGLIAAMQTCSATGVSYLVTLPCDMPFVPDDMVDRLLAASVAAGCPAVACSGGRRHPVCTVWPVLMLERVVGYAAEGRRSLNGALEACSAVEVWWQTSGHDPFDNINTLSDLQRLER